MLISIVLQAKLTKRNSVVNDVVIYLFIYLFFYLTTGYMYFNVSFVLTSLAYITIPKNKRKNKNIPEIKK